jgi:hypothetical protein
MNQQILRASVFLYHFIQSGLSGLLFPEPDPAAVPASVRTTRNKSVADF